MIGTPTNQAIYILVMKRQELGHELVKHASFSPECERIAAGLVTLIHATEHVYKQGARA